VSKRRGLPETSRMRHDSHFVDQLVRADELPVGRRIAIHLIEANPDQPRSVMGDLSELTKSIVDKGVLEPILVRPRGDGRFTIISGERRFRASLDAGLAEIPCIEMDVPDNELLEITLIENLQRKDLSPFEEAEGYKALQERHGYTHEQIADAVGKSRVTITEALSISRLPDRVQAECRRADIESRSFLLELGRLKDEDLMLAAIVAMTNGETLGRDVLREVKKDARRGVTLKLGGLRRAYTLDFAPEDKRYKVSLVLKGRIHKREEILEAVRDLARRIEAGDIDLEAQGRFVKTKSKK
jgi:ParB family chromosome partitioning protein